MASEIAPTQNNVPDVGTDFVTEQEKNLRRVQSAILRRDAQGARVISDMTEITATHIDGIQMRAAIVSDLAIRKLIKDKQDYITGKGLETGELSPAGFKTLSDAIDAQDNKVSTALGLATKITGNNHSSTSRRTVTHVVVHEEDKSPLQQPFELEPSELPSGEVVEGEVDAE